MAGCHTIYRKGLWKRLKKFFAIEIKVRLHLTTERRKVPCFLLCKSQFCVTARSSARCPDETENRNKFTRSRLSRTPPGFKPKSPPHKIAPRTVPPIAQHTDSLAQGCPSQPNEDAPTKYSRHSYVSPSTHGNSILCSGFLSV